MNKFKVGDRVPITVEVRRVHEDGGYRLTFNGAGVDVSSSDLHDRVDTTFRDQAAIAALQAMLINTDVSPGGDARAMAKSSFELAEALDAERKKRDGGE